MRWTFSFLALLCLTAPAFACDCEPHAHEGIELNGRLDMNAFSGGVGAGDYGDDYGGGGGGAAVFVSAQASAMSMASAFASAHAHGFSHGHSGMGHWGGGGWGGSHGGGGGHH